MEIVAPTTQNCLFTTLTQYNDTDRIQLAECQIVKEQPFINTPHSTFIALESFRLSAGLSEHGLLYQIARREWFIEGVMREYDEQATGPDILEAGAPIANVYGGHLMPDADNRCEAEMSVEFDDPTQNNASYALLIERGVGSLSKIKAGSEFKVTSSSGFDGYEAGLTVLTSALHTTGTYGIYGGGAGKFKLHDVFLEVFSEENANIAHQAEGTQEESASAIVKNIVISIDMGSYVNEGLTREDIIQMFSEGTFLYTKEYWGAEETDSHIATILGPAECEVVVDDPSATGEACYDHQPDALRLQISKTPDGTPLSRGDRVNVRTRDGVIHKDAAQISDLNTWFDEVLNQEETAVDYYTAFVTVEFNHTVYTALSEEQRGSLFNSGGDVDQGSHPAKSFNLSTEGNRGFSKHLHGKIRVSSKENDPIAVFPYYDLAFNPLTQTNLSHTTLRRQFEKDTPVYCPNDMFEQYNLRSHDANVQDSWTLTTASNGGFELKVPNGKLTQFRISKAFVEALGLETRMRYIGTDQDFDSSVDLTVMELRPDGDMLQHNENQSLEERLVTHFDPEQLFIDRDNDGNFLSLAVDFLGSGQDANTYYTALASNTGGNVLHDTPSNEETGRYSLVSFDLHNTITKLCTNRFVDPVLRIPGDGSPPYYEYANPPEDSWITNTAAITLESFSLFDAIRIVCPSGVSFTPMVTDVSSGIRVLAEYRIPFIYNCTNQVTGESIVTIDEFYGDIIFNSGASKQYLKVVSSSKVYDCVLRCELVYRNPNHKPPTKQVRIPPTGLFQVKLRWLTTK